MPDEYIHGRDPSETARLERQAAFIGNVLLDRVEVPPEAERVLDLGCGVGAMTRLLVQRGAVHPVGVDRALVQAREARRLTPRGAAEFLVADGTRLPFADASFELVYTSWLLEHVPDVPALLREVHRVLVPGGIFWAAEVENSSLLLHPPLPAFDATWEAFCQAQLDLKGDPYIGRKMSGYLQDAGFAADVWPHSFHGHGGKPADFAAVVREFVEILQSGKENVVARGLVDAATYDAAVAHLAGLPARKGATFTYTFMRCYATTERRGRGNGGERPSR